MARLTALCTRCSIASGYLVSLTAVVLVLSISTIARSDMPRAVPTFECLGLYWSPSGGAANNTCRVHYRAANSAIWKQGFPLWFDERNAEYRGSLVHLRPGTTYDIELSLQTSGTQTTLSARTWTQKFPVAQIIELPTNSSETLIVDQSGTPDGYILYTSPPGASATIDVANSYYHNVEVKASHVIIRGLTLKNAKIHGIRLFEQAHDVIIEDCDISGWGRIHADGWGRNWDAAVYSQVGNVERIIIQRNLMHHPRTDSNNWFEFRSLTGTNHPEGPQAVVLVNSAGNHVIRYNEVFSDDDHYFNDIFGAGSNFSEAGFPNRDSDIYGNHISQCWDDGIESEGANMNVRIWNNFIEWTFVKIAVASTSVGPVYIWRNVAGVARQNDIQSWLDVPRGGFLKTSNKEPSGGKIYVFHNTLLQPPPYPGDAYTLGCSPGFGHGGPMHNVTSRNNILHLYRSWHDSISDGNHDLLGDYDFDLYNGDIEAAPGNELHGIDDVPTYNPTPSFSLVNGMGVFTLAASSPGYDDGERIANFNDGFGGIAPDIGAHEAGTPAMIFGVAGLTPTATIDIDIKPGSYPNSINLGSQGMIPVALLSNIDFDATTVAPETVELAGSGVAVRGKGNKFMAHEEDVNGDGLPDLVCQVETENFESGIEDGYVILTGETIYGLPFVGQDEITIVPSK